VLFEVTEKADEKMSSPEPKTRLALQLKYQRQAPIAANADVGCWLFRM